MKQRNVVAGALGIVALVVFGTILGDNFSNSGTGNTVSNSRTIQAQKPLLWKFQILVLIQAPLRSTRETLFNLPMAVLLFIGLLPTLIRSILIIQALTLYMDWLLVKVIPLLLQELELGATMII